MALLVVVLVAAVVLGRLRGGRLSRLAVLPVRGWLLLAGALAVQAGGPFFGAGGYRAGLAISAALCALFLARNRRLAGMPVVGLALLLNALVVTANGAMPVSRYAAARAGVDFASAVPADDARHEAAGPGTRLPWLGDVVPLALPPRREVVSVGDCLLAAGLALLVLRGVRPREKVGRAERRCRGEEVAQTQGPQAQQGQSWQAAERLSGV